MAFKSFFKYNIGYRNFRSKKDNQYFTVPSGIKATRDRLIIPEFREGIKFRDKSSIQDGIIQVIITKDVERYYASIQYESIEEQVKDILE